MAEPISGQWSVTCLGILAGLLGVLLWVSGADAKSSSANSSSAPPSAVAKAPLCDYRPPRITIVKPDAVKPGQQIVIKGSHFGSKECFHNVSFGTMSANEFTYVSPTMLIATVPNVKPGLVPVNIYTETGMSRFVLLIQAK